VASGSAILVNGNQRVLTQDAVATVTVLGMPTVAAVVNMPTVTKLLRKPELRKQ
jgi:hypothetical protein